MVEAWHPALLTPVKLIPNLSASRLQDTSPARLLTLIKFLFDWDGKRWNSLKVSPSVARPFF
jgi:hypothetical protein